MPYKYNTTEQVDARLKLLKATDETSEEVEALEQIREMLHRQNQRRQSIEEVLEQFKPIHRQLNYHLCGIDVHKWGQVTSDMIRALERRIVDLDPTAPRCVECGDRAGFKDPEDRLHCTRHWTRDCEELKL